MTQTPTTHDGVSLDIVLRFYRFVGPKKLAEIIEKSPKTLANWRSQGDGPPWFKRDGVILYDTDEVADWITEHGHAA